MEKQPRTRSAATDLQMISVIEPQPNGDDLVSHVEEIFSPTGILSKASNFEFRPQQQQMAVAVARALQSQEHLAVEAGTGVGKSLAYLIPAILFAVSQKKKAVISTHTINLQEQLTEKDLPMLAAVLGSLPQPVKFNFTMLKGRANYLCTRRLQKAMQQSGCTGSCGFPVKGMAPAIHQPEKISTHSLACCNPGLPSILKIFHYADTGISVCADRHYLARTPVA